MQSLSLLVFVLLVFAVKDSYQLSSRVVEQRGLCNQTFASYHVERRTSIQTYVVNYYFGCGSWWNRRRCHGTRTGYRRINVYMSPAVYYTAVLTCCYGYNGEPPNCEANCPQGCQNNGTCILPGICACTSGWTGSDCTKGIKNEFYLSFFHHLSNSPSIVIMTSKHQTIFYSIRAPGLGYNISGHFTASNKATIDLPKSLMTTSHEQHNKGVYIMTNGSRVTLLSGNGASDSYVAFPNARVCFQEYVYYGILFGFGHVLVVGTEDNTILKLTVEPQAVNITLHHNNTTLVSPGKQYSFIINRLQTVLIEMVKESKIVANKPISTFSGHKCGSVPTKSGVCGHIVEQIPPTTLWGKVYYTVPFSNRSEYTIKVLAACDNTNIDIYCDGIVTSYTIHEGMDVTKTLNQEQCVIYSNKKLLASLYSHSYWDTNDDQYKHNPMMTLVPSVDLYSNKISSSTISNSNPVRSDYTHYVNIIVQAEYYQPEMIHLITGGLSHSMDSQQWESIEANGTIEAYATTATISEGVVEIIHANTSALMTAIVYGFANSASYGHSGGSYNLEKFTDCRVCDDIQSNTSSPNITGLPEVKVIPTEQTVEITHSAKFSTVVIGVGVGNFVYQWRYNGINIIGETGDTLLLSEVLKRHKGRYDCIVTNEYGVYAISNKAKLNFRRNPPHATVQPNVAFASLAANFDFHCESNGAVSYKWERLNGRIPSGAIGKNSNALTIYNVQLEDADHYRCVATNKSGSGVSDYVELTINTYIPHLIEHPKNQTVDIYTSTNFECKAKLYGSTQINWKKEGSSRLPASATVATNISNDVITSILKIDEIISYYSGDYYCAATNEIGEANSSQAQLHVNIPCPEILKAPHNITKIPGKMADFECLAYSHTTLQYQWKKTEKLLLLSTSEITCAQNGSEEYSIDNTYPSDEGWYCCVVTNECGAVQECAWLEMDTTPVIVKNPKSVVTKEYSKEVFLEFSAHDYGVGNIQYRWEKYQPYNDKWMTPSRKDKIFISPKLVFDVIREEDQGLYHCVATNNDGSAISENATITVYGPPTIDYISDTLVTFEGTKARLKCNATNDEDAVNHLTVVWHNPEGIILETIHQQILIYNTTDSVSGQVQLVLLFDQVNHTDSGEYTCYAFNDKDCYTENKTNLTVEYTPRVSITPSSPYRVCIGHFVPVLCRAEGLPIPTVQWYQGNKAVKRIAELSEQVYHTPTDVSHNTTYTCVSKNKAGGIIRTSKISLTLIVQPLCPPLSLPENGFIPFKDCKFALFICKSEYQMQGSPILACTNGKWNFDPPKCVKKPQ